MADSARRGRETARQGAALNQFLMGVERRALRMAELAVHNREDALDIVQDAMMGLATKYSDRPAEEWRPLFFRILNNRIMDAHRRRAVRARVFSWLPFRRRDDDEPSEDPLDYAPGRASLEPDRAVGIAGAAEATIEAVAGLPARQQQAFMLRAWEGLDVAQTAAAMECSAGSVKTHYFRALKALREHLGDHWDG